MSFSAQVSRIAANKLSMKGVKVARRYLKSTASAIIVNFHRFYEGKAVFLKKGPSAHTNIKDFETFIALLSNRYEFISLSQLLDHLETDTPLAADSVVITMDDGYQDNYTLALPVLKKYGIPATLYVATSFIESKKLLPMDRIELAIRTTGLNKLEWPFLSGAPIKLDTYRDRCEANILAGKYIKEVSTKEMDNKISELYQRLQVSEVAENSPMLSWLQIKKMAENGIEIGSHGVSHILMTQLTESNAIEELHRSRDVIKKEVGDQPIHFAYPNGRAEDFSDALRIEARRAGYRTVVSTTRSIIRPGVTHPLNLPRIGLIGTPQQTVVFMERLLFSNKPFAERIN